MKKLFFALVTAVALVSFASCGGDSKSSAETKAVNMFKEMYAAGEADDLEKFTKLAEEFDAWFKNLPESEQEKVHKAVMDWDEEKAEQVIDAANEILY
jgi:hypothetical protein